ncbi:MAG: DEAD/DEAH box helicase [Gammaproteobacteria bacterium]
MSSNKSATFKGLALTKPVLKAIDEAGFETPSPLQSEVIPTLLEGQSAIIEAMPGSGKTAAYVIPLVERLIAAQVDDTDTGSQTPSVLVVTPTRERAINVAACFQRFARHADMAMPALSAYGNALSAAQQRHLERGVRLITGTATRLLELVTDEGFDPSTLGCVVFDECDEAARSGFSTDMRALLDALPSDIQWVFTGNNMPKGIAAAAKEHTAQARTLVLDEITASEAAAWEGVVPQQREIRAFDKLETLSRLTDLESFESMVVVARGALDCGRITDHLSAQGHSCVAVHGRLKKADRDTALRTFNNGDADIAVLTTSYASQVKRVGLTHVIGYDLPWTSDELAGRQALIGADTESASHILLSQPRERRWVRALEKATGVRFGNVTVEPLDNANDRRVAGFKQRIATTAARQDLSLFDGLLAELREETEIDAEKLASTLAFMAQKDRPLITDEAPKERRPKREEEPQNKRDARGHEPEPGMARYRIEVGRANRVKPGNIVGALTNEADLEAADIGHIKIFDRFSLVDLPENIQQETLDHLAGLWVCGRRLDISRDGEKQAEPDRGGRKPPRERTESAPRTRSSGPRRSRADSGDGGGNRDRDSGNRDGNRDGGNRAGGKRKRPSRSNNGNAGNRARNEPQPGNSYHEDDDQTAFFKPGREISNANNLFPSDPSFTTGQSRRRRM